MLAREAARDRGRGRGARVGHPRPGARRGSGCARSRARRRARRSRPSPPTADSISSSVAQRQRDASPSRAPDRPRAPRPRRRCRTGRASGSSPCTLTTISASMPARGLRQPVGAGGVRRRGHHHLAAEAAHGRGDALVVGGDQHAIHASGARARARHTCWIIGLPWISERGFPGRRVEPKRAGMIATMAKSVGALV